MLKRKVATRLPPMLVVRLVAMMVVVVMEARMRKTRNGRSTWALLLHVLTKT